MRVDHTAISIPQPHLYRRREWLGGFIQKCGDIKVEILNLRTIIQGQTCSLLSYYLVKCCPFSGISAQHTRDQALTLPAEKELSLLCL